MLDGRCRGDPHLVYTVRRRVISMTRAPCRCSASPSFTLRPASLLLHSHRRRSWHDSGTPGDGFARSCWTEAYAHRASLLCGPVFLLRVCVLCGVCVSVVNISLIGVIYGSGESIHLTVAHRQKLALAHRSRPRNGSSLRKAEASIFSSTPRGRAILTPVRAPAPSPQRRARAARAGTPLIV